MYFIFNGKIPELHQYVKFLLRRDTLLSYGEEINELHYDPPIPKKKCKQSAWLISVTQHSVFEEVGADFESFLNQANKEWNIYELFEEHLISEGEI